MSQVIIAGDVSGTVTLQAPSTAGTTVLTLPSTSGYVQAPATVGTSGQFLTSAGGGAPTWTAAPASALTLISTQTANNTSSSLSWTGLSGYKNYLLVLNQLLIAGTSDYQLTLKIGTGSGPTYATSGYVWTGSFTNISNSTVTGQYSPSANNMQVNLSVPQAQGNGGTGTNGSYYIDNFNVSGGLCTLYGQFFLVTTGGGTAAGTIESQLSGTSGPYTAIQLGNSGSANLYSGSASLYGISS